MKESEQCKPSKGCPQPDRSKRCGCHQNGKAASKQQNPAHVMQEISQEAHSDVLGSYTGTPADGGQPVQDADDL